MARKMAEKVRVKGLAGQMSCVTLPYITASPTEFPETSRPNSRKSFPSSFPLLLPISPHPLSANLHVRHSSSPLASQADLCRRNGRWWHFILVSWVHIILKKRFRKFPSMQFSHTGHKTSGNISVRKDWKYPELAIFDGWGHSFQDTSASFLKGGKVWIAEKEKELARVFLGIIALKVPMPYSFPRRPNQLTGWLRTCSLPGCLYRKRLAQRPSSWTMLTLRNLQAARALIASETEISLSKHVDVDLSSRRHMRDV